MCWHLCKPRCRVIMRPEHRSLTFAFTERLLGEGIVVLALLGWWLLARGLPEFILPGPIAVVRRLIEMGRSFTRHRARILWRLTLPLLVPYGLSATRIAYGIAWKIALVAELLGAPTGIGYLMLRAQTAADSTTFLATCFAVVLIFVAGERLVIVPLERRFARR